jgi:GT2 family glycosyltransferase
MGNRLGIVIPVIGQFEYTKQIVDNIRKTAKSNYKIYIVNNSQEKKDIDDLRTLEGVFVHDNHINHGCSASWNQGMAQAYFDQQDYVAILNNDILLSNNWDINMVDAFETLDVGVVFPGVLSRLDIDDSILGMMKVTPCAANDIFDMEIGGFCFMLKRGDYGFGAGNFDPTLKYWYGDAEYWARTKIEHKKRIVGVKSVYCHHFESKTLFSLPDAHEQMEKDAYRYQEIIRRYGDSYA